MLLLQRGRPRHHRVDTAGALWALRPKAPLAPEAPWPNRPLSGVVRGFHPCVTHDCPQALPPRQDLPAGALCRGNPTGLARASSRSISRRTGHIELAKVGWASVPSRTRCHQWHI